MKYIPAESLKGKFTVFGSFYNINKNGNNIARCRNNLEIFEKSYFEHLDKYEAIDQFTEKPDALAVMMNPGKNFA